MALVLGLVAGMAAAVAVDLKKGNPFKNNEKEEKMFDMSVFDEAIKTISPSHGLIK